MDDFDKAEWMDENNRSEGYAWKALKGRPDFEFCDVRLKNGKEAGPCWPQEKDFLDCSRDDEATYPFSNVTHVRYYDIRDKDEEDLGEEDEVAISEAELQDLLPGKVLLDHDE